MFLLLCLIAGKLNCLHYWWHVDYIKNVVDIPLRLLSSVTYKKTKHIESCVCLSVIYYVDSALA